MRRWIGFAGALALGLFIVLVLRETREARVAEPVPKAERLEEAPNRAAPLPPRSASEGLAAESPPEVAAELPAGARRYQKVHALQQEARAFFAQQDALPEAEREARAAEVRKQVQAKQREGLLVPSEALVLELGLLRATFDDLAVYEHEARSLIEKHAEEAERQRERREGQQDGRFDAYKRREAEVVREVMALEEIPDGRSRAEYLREQLQRLRSEIYAGGTSEAIPPAPATP